MRLHARLSWDGCVLWGRCSRARVLWVCLEVRSLLKFVGEQGLHLQVDAVGPSEANDVAFVPRCYGNVGGTADYVVFFADGGVG